MNPGGGVNGSMALKMPYFYSKKRAVVLAKIWAAQSVATSTRRNVILAYLDQILRVLGSLTPRFA
jgi:hypothetical protein